MNNKIASTTQNTEHGTRREEERAYFGAWLAVMEHAGIKQNRLVSGSEIFSFHLLMLMVLLLYEGLFLCNLSLYGRICSFSFVFKSHACSNFYCRLWFYYGMVYEAYEAG